MLRLGALDAPTRTRLSDLAAGAEVNVVVGQALGDLEQDAGWHLVLTAVAASGDADVVLDDSAQDSRSYGQGSTDLPVAP